MLNTYQFLNIIFYSIDLIIFVIPSILFSYWTMNRACISEAVEGKGATWVVMVFNKLVLAMGRSGDMEFEGCMEG
jgi:hypothetical protein